MTVTTILSLQWESLNLQKRSSYWMITLIRHKKLGSTQKCFASIHQLPLYLGNTWAVCIQLTHLSYDDCENKCSLSYYHHHIGSMTHLPLFRVRSLNNGMHCRSLYILTLVKYPHLLNAIILSHREMHTRLYCYWNKVNVIIKCDFFFICEDHDVGLRANYHVKPFALIGFYYNISTWHPPHKGRWATRVVDAGDGYGFREYDRLYSLSDIYILPSPCLFLYIWDVNKFCNLYCWAYFALRDCLHRHLPKSYKQYNIVLLFASAEITKQL